MKQLLHLNEMHNLHEGGVLLCQQSGARKTIKFDLFWLIVLWWFLETIWWWPLVILISSEAQKRCKENGRRTNCDSLLKQPSAKSVKLVKPRLTPIKNLCGLNLFIKLSQPTGFNPLTLGDSSPKAKNSLTFSVKRHLVKWMLPHKPSADWSLKSLLLVHWPPASCQTKLKLPRTVLAHSTVYFGGVSRIIEHP